MRITTKGFVVHKQDLKDIDVLATIFTESHGLLKAVAQKAKKRSQLLALLEPFQESTFTINQTENLGTIYRLESGTLFPGIRTSYEVYVLACHFTLIIKALLPLNMPHPALYSLYRQYLFYCLRTPIIRNRFVWIFTEQCYTLRGWPLKPNQ